MPLRLVSKRKSYLSSSKSLQSAAESTVPFGPCVLARERSIRSYRNPFETKTNNDQEAHETHKRRMSSAVGLLVQHDALGGHYSQQPFKWQDLCFFERHCFPIIRKHDCPSLSSLSFSLLCSLSSSPFSHPLPSSTQPFHSIVFDGGSRTQMTSV